MFSFSRSSAATLAAITILTSSYVPVLAQSTTLTGSVARTGSSETPVLRAQTARMDVMPTSSHTATVTKTARPSTAPPRTIVKTVVVEKRDNRTYFQRHPRVKSAVVGAGIGAGAGAVTGLISRRGVLRGAAIGAGTGAGVGLVRSTSTMKRHPIVNDTVTGAAVGFGLGAAGSRRGRTMAKSAAIGGAIGLGYSLFKKMR